MAGRVIYTQAELDALEIGSMILVGDYVYYLAGSPERLNLRGMWYCLREGFVSLLGGGGRSPEDMSRYIRPRKKLGWHLYGVPPTKFEREDLYLRDAPLPVTLMYPGTTK